MNVETAVPLCLADDQEKAGPSCPDTEYKNVTFTGAATVAYTAPEPIQETGAGYSQIVPNSGEDEIKQARYDLLNHFCMSCILSTYTVSVCR